MDIETRKTDAQTWFRTLRDRICAEFEAIEDAATGDAAAGRFEAPCALALNLAQILGFAAGAFMTKAAT